MWVIVLLLGACASDPADSRDDLREILEPRSHDS
jgi:hypothetical protein